jgi:hypothetical protein
VSGAEAPAPTLTIWRSVRRLGSGYTKPGRRAGRSAPLPTLRAGTGGPSARSGHPGPRFAGPIYLTGLGEDEVPALRDLDARLRGERSEGPRWLEELRARLRFAYLDGAEERSRQELGRPFGPGWQGTPARSAQGSTIDRCRFHGDEDLRALARAAHGGGCCGPQAAVLRPAILAASRRVARVGPGSSLNDAKASRMYRDRPVDTVRDASASLPISSDLEASGACTGIWTRLQRIGLPEFEQLSRPGRHS